VRADSPVATAGGDRIGPLAEIVVDPTGAVTHLVVGVDAVAGAGKAIPVEWADTVSESLIPLTTAAASFDGLPALDPERPPSR